MKVDLETIRLINAIRLSINSTPIDEIEWYENDKKVDIAKKAIFEFLYTGLNNIDFINSGYYKRHRNKIKS